MPCSPTARGRRTRSTCTRPTSTCCPGTSRPAPAAASTRRCACTTAPTYGSLGMDAYAFGPAAAPGRGPGRRHNAGVTPLASLSTPRLLLRASDPAFAEAAADFYRRNREAHACWNPPMPDAMFSVDGQRERLSEAAAAAGAGTQHRLVAVCDRRTRRRARSDPLLADRPARLLQCDARLRHRRRARGPRPDARGAASRTGRRLRPARAPAPRAGQRAAREHAQPGAARSRWASSARAWRANTCSSTAPGATMS